MWRTRPTGANAIVLAGVLIAPGCSTDHDAQPLVFRDSVGIRIVENHTPVWHPTEAWTIDPDPAVEIGVREGEPTYQLFRVYNALRLEDGRILVSNRGSSEVRFCNAAISRSIRPSPVHAL